MKALITVLLLFTFAVPQQPDSTETLKATVKKFRNGKRFRVNYDKFRDRTWVSVWFATGSKQGGLLAGEVGFKGQSPKDAQTHTYYFVFEAYGRNWRHLEEENQKLFAIVDGERFELEGEHDGNISTGSYTHRVSVREEIAFKLDVGTFRKLATGKSVELKIGGNEFRLKDEHQEAFRDLLSLTAP